MHAPADQLTADLMADVQREAAAIRAELALVRAGLGWISPTGRRLKDAAECAGRARLMFDAGATTEHDEETAHALRQVGARLQIERAADLLDRASDWIIRREIGDRAYQAATIARSISLQTGRRL